MTNDQNNFNETNDDNHSIHSESFQHLKLEIKEGWEWDKDEYREKKDEDEDDDEENKKDLDKCRIWG